MADKLQAALHGAHVAGGVHHHVKKLAVGARGELGLIALAQRHRGGHTEFAGTKIKPVLARIQRCHHRPA